MFTWCTIDHRNNNGRRRKTELRFTTSVLTVLVVLILAVLVAAGVLTPDVFTRAVGVL